MRWLRYITLHVPVYTGFAGLTMVILRNGRHADADAGLLGDRMDGVRAIDVGEGEAEVLLHGAQAEVFGV